MVAELRLIAKVNDSAVILENSPAVLEVVHCADGQGDTVRTNQCFHSILRNNTVAMQQTAALLLHAVAAGVYIKCRTTEQN